MPALFLEDLLRKFCEIPEDFFLSLEKMTESSSTNVC